MPKTTMTYDCLAARLGLSASTVWRLLTGVRRVGPHAAKRIAEARREDDWRRYVHITPEELKALLGL